jgi:hypothetical protein
MGDSLMCDIAATMMEVEQHFGVTIPDERACLMNTFGDLYLYLLGRSRRRAQGPCPTGQAFYRLRRALTGEFGMDRERVRHGSRLCDLFPTAARRTTWPRLAAALGLPDLPELPRRRGPSARTFRLIAAWVTAAWWILCPIFALVTGDESMLSPWYILLVWFLLMVLVCEMVGLFWAAGWIDYRERVRVPQVRHLVVRLALRQTDPSAAGEPTPQRVWADLVAIFARQAGLSAQEIHPEMRFSDLPGDC